MRKLTTGFLVKTTGFPVKTTGFPGVWTCGAEGLGEPRNWSWAVARVGKGLLVVLTVVAGGVVVLLTGDDPRLGKGLVLALAVVRLGVVLLVVRAVVVVGLVVI